MADARNAPRVIVSRSDYTAEDLRSAIRSVGIGAGDVVSLQVSLGRLGVPRGTSRDFGEISQLVIDAFMDVIGRGGTLVVPTYTYSIGRGEVFDVERTPSAIGEFPELFRARPGAIRSRDPMLSTAAIGPRAEQVVRRISRSCYGDDSTYHRLREVGAKICTLGLGLYWATFRHHIEEMAGVPFRFRKLFDGVVRERGVESRERWIYCAAPLVDCCQPNGLPLQERAQAEGLVAVAAVGRAQIMSIDAREYFDFGRQELRRDPWLSAKGPACDRRELVRLEDARVGAKREQVSLEPGASMLDMIDAIWRLPRDLVSDGYDAALAALSRQVPMTVHEYPTGTECWTWIVPEKWTCREAWLETLKGRRLFSYADNPLHVASYSHPVDAVVAREELDAHLHGHPVLPDAVPYREVFYRREWELCCSQTLRATLTDDAYRVRVDSAFSFGTLKVGEAVLHGDRPESVVLCAHLDHPTQVNDGLSGCVVALDVMRELAKRHRPRFTYRLLLVPRTIGSIAYLSHHEDLIAHMRGGIFLDMLGLDNPLTLQHSLDPHSVFDRCAATVLRAIDPGLRTWRFLDVITSDERQFNAPGVRVPMVSLSRVERPEARGNAPVFAEYHSDHDTPAIVSVDRLNESRAAILAIVDAWEARVVPKPLFRGEPFLSRYGIDYGCAPGDHDARTLFDVMHAVDGVRSTGDIATEIGRPPHTVERVIETLRAAGLVDAPPLEH